MPDFLDGQQYTWISGHKPNEAIQVGPFPGVRLEDEEKGALKLYIESHVPIIVVSVDAGPLDPDADQPADSPDYVTLVWQPHVAVPSTHQLGRLLLLLVATWVKGREDHLASIAV